MFEFGALPPEVNSAWMYTGPGSAPMMAAGAAWRALAVELGSTAAAYQAVIGRMAGEQWMGQASAAMVAAAAPYVAWLNTTAGQAEQAATQATAAAAAFETAFAATVPPAVITANRSLLMSLVATNVLGQNTPAITATEAQYAQMWVQDAAAMYGYAGASAAAAQVTPFTEPVQTTNPAGLASQAAAVTQTTGTSAGSYSEVSQLIAALPSALQSLASPVQTGSSSSTASGLTGMLGSLLNPSTITDNVNGAVNTGAWNVASTLSTALGFLSNMGSSAGKAMSSTMSGALGTTVGAVGPAASLGPVSLTGLCGLTGVGGTAVSAGLGQAGSVGMLSVPQSWAAGATVTPTSTAAAALPGTGWSLAAESGSAAVPAGMPVGGIGGRGGSNSNLPRYGFKPTVIPHPFLAG